LRDIYFKSSKIQPDQITKFFSKVTCTEAEFVSRVREAGKRPLNDLTVFQAYPLVELAKDIHPCLDPGFLLDKAGRSFFWNLFFQVPAADREMLFAFWGVLFESYVNYLLVESYAAGGTLICEPKFSNGDAAFDACILAGC
jgi:hypothetical protein